MTIFSASAPASQDVVTGSELRRFMRRWATGVAIVTAAAAGRPAGCTVNSFTSVSLDPPLVLVCMTATSRTLSAVIGQRAFGVNLLGTRQRWLAERFATTGADHFRGVSFRMLYDVPVIDGTIAAVVCAVESILPVADHVLLLGTPQWSTQTEQHSAPLNENADCGQPLVFFAGHYLTATTEDI